MIYFDNAASSYPKPPSVIQEVSRWIKINGANPGRSGHKPAMDAASVIFDTRCTLADMFGISSPENIAFVPNATFGLNMVLQGIARDGDHIVTTELEHNSVLRPLEHLKMTRNIIFDTVSVDFYDDDVTVENIIGAINPNTRIVVCTQCSNVWGKVMPIKKIASALPDDILFVVDGSQGAGIVPTDIEKDGIDYYCAPSHKGLLGLQGSGFVAINADVPKPIISGGTGSDSMSLLQPMHMPDVLECGTLPTPSVLSMKVGAEYLMNIGVNKVYERKKQLTIFADECLKAIDGVLTYVDTKRSEFVGVISFNVIDRYSDEVANFLSQNGICVRSGIHCAPLAHKKLGTQSMGAVRISLGYANTSSEIEILAKKLNKYLKI